MVVLVMIEGVNGRRQEDQETNSHRGTSKHERSLSNGHAAPKRAKRARK